MGGELSGRVLAVDPGDARIGLAISDEGRTVARPLRVLRHESREKDSAAIAAEADRMGANLILVGFPLDEDGKPGPQARKALRLADSLRAQTSVAVETWDESGSTVEAASLDPSQRTLDARAAAVFLQDYLNAQIV